LSLPGLSRTPSPFSSVSTTAARATAIHDGAERRLNLLSTRHAETIKRLTDILDGVSGLVAAETARMSLEDEVDQNTAKAIAASTESNGSPRPAAEPATAGPRPASPGGPRPAAPGSSATARPAAPSPSPQATQASPTQASSAASSSAPAQDKPTRAAVVDPEEKADGVRLRPGSDNLGLPPHYR